MQRLLAHTSDLMALFGCSLDKVDQMLIRMARLENPPPSWLQGVTKIDQLPRYEASDSEEFAVSLTGIDVNEFTERVAWIVENLADPWSLDAQTVKLSSTRDLVHYNLRWAEF